MLKNEIISAFNKLLSLIFYKIKPKNSSRALNELVERSDTTSESIYKNDIYFSYLEVFY